MQQYESHPITRDMAGITTLFPLTRSVGHAPRPPPAGVNVQALAKTSAGAGARRTVEALERGQAKPDPQDVKGPAHGGRGRHQGQGADRRVRHRRTWPANQFLNIQGNRDFFLNTVSWLAEQEDQISIRPKDTKQTPVFLTSQQAQAVFCCRWWSCPRSCW